MLRSCQPFLTAATVLLTGASLSPAAASILPLPDIAAEVSGYGNWSDFTANAPYWDEPLDGQIRTVDGATVTYFLANDRRGHIIGFSADSRLGALPVRGRIRVHERLDTTGVSTFDYDNRVVLRGRRGRDRVRLILTSQGRIIGGDEVAASSLTPGPNAYEFALRRRSDVTGIQRSTGTVVFHSRRQLELESLDRVRNERLRPRRSVRVWSATWRDGAFSFPGRVRLDAWERRDGQRLWRARARGRHVRAQLVGTIADPAWQPLEGFDTIPLRVERYVVRTSMGRFEVLMP